MDELAVAEAREPLMEAFGKAMTLKQWVDHTLCRVPRPVVEQRLSAGWDLEQALTRSETAKTTAERIDEVRRAAPGATSSRDIGDALGLTAQRVRQLIAKMPEPGRSATRALLAANRGQRKAQQDRLRQKKTRQDPKPFRPTDTEVAELLALIASAKTVNGATPPDSPQRRDAVRRDQVALGWKERGATRSEIARLAGVSIPGVDRWLDPRKLAARRAWPTQRSDAQPPPTPAR